MNSNYSKILIGAFALAISVKANSIGSNNTSNETKDKAKRDLIFTENNGQVSDQNHVSRPDVLFSGITNGLVYHLRNNGISYQLSRVDSWKSPSEIEKGLAGKNKKFDTKIPFETTVYRLDLNWKNINKDYSVIKENEQAETANYYLENVSEGVNTVKSYSGVFYKNIYKNIDLHYYQKENNLKYDYIVAPHANYKQIQLEVSGAKNIRVQKDGSLLLSTPLGQIQEGAPVVFQNGNQLKAKWVIKKNILSFEIQNYNPELELIIDPASRVWGTYYGGTGNEFGQSTSVDASGNVYLAGYTNSSLGTIIATSGSNQTTFGGGLSDAFLVKFNSAGVRQWATYYGGTGNDYGYSCKTDISGNVFLTGYTTTGSSALIASTGAHQTTYGGNNDAFLVKFNSAGVRQWGTYYGGSGGDIAYACATDASGNVYITGYSGTSGGTSIATAGSHQTAMGGSFDAFVAKFNASGVRQWGTYYGGTGGEYGYGCSTDASGNVYMTGFTNSSNAISTPGSHQPIFGGGDDLFLVKFNSAGVRQWGTYYGESAGNDYGYACACDISGNVYVAGLTSSSTSNIIATAGSNQPAYGGNYDAFLAKFNSAGVRQWGTYYGDTGYDEAQSCSTDGSGNVYLAGLTSTFIGSSIATPGTYQVANGGGNDAFLAKFNATGVRQWGTYYGGVGGDVGYSCASDATDYVYLSGRTNTSTSGIIASSGSHQAANGGNDDAFVVKFCNMPDAPTNLTPVANQTLCAGGTTTLYANGSGSISWFANPTGGSPITTGTVLTTGALSAGTYTYYVEASTCSVSPVRTAITVSVNAYPTITVNSGTICTGGSFTMVPSGAATYTIQGGSAVVTPTVTSTYTVTGSSSFGCLAASNATATVVVNSLPVVTVNSGSVCAGNSFTMNPTGASSYTFQGGSAVVTPTATSSYTVIGQDANGCQSSTFATSNVTVVANPTISVNSGSVCAGNSFTMVPTGAASYTFQGGSAVVTPASTTNYTVQGTNAAGCLSNMVISNVVVKALPIVNAIASLTFICTGQNTNITGLGAQTYSWSTGSTSTVIAVSPTVTTTYTVIGTDINGCMKSATETVSVSPLPTVVAVSSPTAYCVGQTATLTASGAFTYSWSTGSMGNPIGVAPLTTTSYTVRGTDINGCANITTVAVVVNPNPTITVSPANNVVCLGQSTTVTAGGANTYTWSTGANTASVALSPTVVTTYTVDGTDANGCSNSSVISVSVNALPTIGTSVSPLIVCAGQVDTLSAGGALTYTWSTTATGSLTTVTPTITTTYTVSGTDVNGCTNTALATVSVNPLPALTISPSSSLICSGQTSTISVSGAVSYTWSTTSNSTSIVVSPTVNTTYTVDATDVNGCMNTDTITQFVSPCTGINGIASIVESINVYPNPSNGVYTVTLPGEATIQITDLFGKQVFVKKLEEGKQTVDLSDFANGLYIMNIEANGNSKTIKLIKQ